MDIKALLLQSVTAKQILRGTRRLYYGKFCFIIKFEVRGKYMSILSVKRKRRNRSALYRNIKRKVRLIKKYKRAYHRWLLTNDIRKGSGDNCDSVAGKPYGNKSILMAKPTLTSTATMTENIEIEKFDKGIQSETEMDEEGIKERPSTTTFYVKQPLQCQQRHQQCQHQEQQKQQQLGIMKRHVGCNTLVISTKSASQQTLTMVRFNGNNRNSHAVKSFPFGCQTELITNAQGIQCKCKTNSLASQTTEVFMNCAYTQVWQEDVMTITPRLSKFLNLRSSIMNNEETEETNSTNIDCFEMYDEKEAVVYMLSEIGELVLNQNHMLSNNSQMLNQLSDIAMCNKQLAVGTSWSCNKKKCCMCWNRNWRSQSTTPSRKHSKAITKIVEKVSKETQCEIILKVEMVSKATETTIDLMKPRRLRFLDKTDVGQQRLDMKQKTKRVMN